MATEAESAWFDGERTGVNLAQRLRIAEARNPGADKAESLDRLAVVEDMCDRHFDLIRLADQKAQFLLRMTMMLFGAAFIGVPPSVVVLKKFMDNGGWGAITLFATIALLYLMCATCLLMAMSKILSAVRPRIADQSELSTRLLFTSIAAESVAEFRRDVARLTREQLFDETMGQAYQSSVIARHKFRKLNEAFGWMLGGGVAGIMFALILLVSSGLTSGS